MDKYTRELTKYLYKNLPSTVEYNPSRRIEGWMDTSDVPGPHKDVTIIVDDAVSRQDYAQIMDKVYLFLRKDQFFRRSHYRIILWKQDTFSMQQPGRFNNIRNKQHLFDEVPVSGTQSNSWRNFLQLYAPHTKAGQVILITTKEMVEELRTEKMSKRKNLLITYCADSNAKPVETIFGNLCIACEEKRNENEVST